MFCPECECEYLEGITECVDCRIRLVQKLPRPEETEIPEETQPQNDVMVEIRNYPGMGYGSIIRDFLAENGIPAFLSSGGFFPTERIMVPEPLAKKAETLIMEFDEAASNNEDQTEPDNMDNQMDW